MLKMIFSVQNSSLMFLIDFSTDLVKKESARNNLWSFLARMVIAIQVWHMVELLHRGFNEHHKTQEPMTENQLGEMQMMEEVVEHV